MFSCANITQNIRVEGTYQSGIKILPCCVYQTKNVYATVDQYLTGQEYVKLKSATDWPSGCAVCQQQEQQNQRSYRQDANAFFAEQTGLKVEIFPSNVCNLKCFMCGPDVSTALAQERYRLGMSDKQWTKEFEIADDCMDIINQIDDVSTVSIIGGEFFLTRRNIELLDLVIEKNLKLRVVTNATVITDQHLQKLQQIKDLDLQISIDGVVESFEFMRYPADWITFDTNVRRLCKLSNAQINFHYVVQPLNCLHLIPTMEYVNQLRKPCRITNLIEPKHLSWSVLTDEERADIKQTIEQQILHSKITISQKNFANTLISTINQCKFDSVKRQQFINFLKSTLAFRQLSDSKIYNHFGPLSVLSSDIISK